MTAVATEIRYVRPHLYPKQADFLFTPARYSLVEASTKSGKTVGCLVWLFEQAALHGGEGKNFWWIAPTYAVATIAFRRLKRFVPRGLYVANESDHTVTLLNGAMIWFKGADKPDSLYGEDVYAAVIDEATRCKDDAWHAVRSTLTATRGPVRIIGNVKGRKNWAYLMARKAEQGTPDMAYFKLTAYDAVAGGVLAAEEVEDAKRTLPDNVFRELYLAEPSDDGGNPFGLDAIHACEGQLSPEKPVVWGIDLAKSVDYTVAIALDAAGNVCRLERFQRPWTETLATLGVLVNGGRALVDSTGVGDPILEQLQRGGRGNFTGYQFTQPSKQKLMEGLAVYLQQRVGTIPKGSPLIGELEAFEYEYTRTGVRYSAPQGLHDDCVCALALAVEHRRAPTPRVRSLS